MVLLEVADLICEHRWMLDQDLKQHDTMVVG